LLFGSSLEKRGQRSEVKCQKSENTTLFEVSSFNKKNDYVVIFIATFIFRCVTHCIVL
jgi:hypothetical protein